MSEGERRAGERALALGRGAGPVGQSGAAGSWAKVGQRLAGPQGAPGPSWPRSRWCVCVVFFC